MCGPKLATCGLVISVWGVIMLAMLGIFFTTHSALLIEDVPLSKEDMQDLNPPQKAYSVFNTIGTNCFVAAIAYLILGTVCCWQLRVSKQKAYLVR